MKCNKMLQRNEREKERGRERETEGGRGWGGRCCLNVSYNALLRVRIMGSQSLLRMWTLGVSRKCKTEVVDHAIWRQ